MKLHITLEDGTSALERTILINTNRKVDVNKIIECMADTIQKVKADNWFKKGMGQSSIGNLPTGFIELPEEHE